MNGKKPTGRPPQPPRRQFSVSVSEERYVNLEKLAALEGMSVSEYVRFKVFGETSIRASGDQFAEGIPLPRNREDFEKMTVKAALQFNELMKTYTDHMAKVNQFQRHKERGEPVGAFDEFFYGDGTMTDPTTGKVIAKVLSESEVKS